MDIYSHTNRKLLFTHIIITTLLFIVAFLIRINSFIDMDVAWHIEGGRRLLKGAGYLTQVFDDNSPLVFLYWAPVILLKKITYLSYKVLTPLYMLLVNAVTAFLIAMIFKQTTQLPSRNKYFFFYLILFIILFLPIINFGQREVILVSLVLPYFYLLLFTTEYNNSYPLTLSITVALLAAFGIWQNFIYLSVIIGLDLIRWFKFQRFSSYQLYFYLGFFLLLLATYLSYSNYFTAIIPMVICYETAYNSALGLLFTGTTLICLIELLLAIVNVKKLDRIMQMTTAALMISLSIYFLERKNWYYHLYPAFTFAILLNGMFFNYNKKVIANQKAHQSNYFTLIITTSVMILTFLATINFTVGIITEFHNPNYRWNKWLTYINENFSNKKLFLLMSYDPPIHQLPIYTSAQVTSPWFNTWFRPALRSDHKLPAFCNPQRDLKLIHAMILQNVAATKPDFIFVRFYEPHENPSSKNLFSPEEVIAYLSHDYQFYKNYDGMVIYQRK